MLHVIRTRMRLGHLSLRVGDSSRHSKEIVNKSGIAPFSATIITITIIIIIIIIIISSSSSSGGGGGGGRSSSSRGLRRRRSSSL